VWLVKLDDLIEPLLSPSTKGCTCLGVKADLPVVAVQSTNAVKLRSDWPIEYHL
jgi:hypothetical protein